ncbi:MAG: hypothetical protein DCF30_01865 [Hyphomicrobiales bacterium]|nr:MAG: hypothetical protein DCF30_01865 [Hyphomicrobiales bacterium]
MPVASGACLLSEPFLVISRVDTRPDAWEPFVAAAADCIEATRKEQGCLAYEIHESLTQPGRFVSFESWETRADIDRHMLGSHAGFSGGAEGLRHGAGGDRSGRTTVDRPPLIPSVTDVSSCFAPPPSFARPPSGKTASSIR